jgi:hypothetical protein
MPPLGFEPTIPASTRPQTYALDRAATGIGETESDGPKQLQSTRNEIQLYPTKFMFHRTD